MITSQPHKKLFRIPTTVDTISLFRSLLESRELKPSEALALSSSIHAELRHAKGRDGSAYARYAQTMALLNHHLPEVHQHVVANWHLPQVKSSPPVRSYDDSLFDDTAVMQLPGMRSVSEVGREPVKEEGEILEIAGSEEETVGESELEADQAEYEEAEEPEEIEPEELVYDDISETESYKELEVETDDESMAREAAEADVHMNEVEYEIEPMEDEELP